MTSATRLAIIVGVLGMGLAGWIVGGYLGAAIGLMVAALAGLVPWRGQPGWSWLALWRRRRRPITWTEPLTVVNDRAGGGV
jgi:hypothetical protein